MGGHSGPSSDDLIFIFGISKDNFRTYLSYNKERHGIKSMNNPEIKSEFSLIQKYELSQKHIFTIVLEHEIIENYSFISNKNSKIFSRVGEIKKYFKYHCMIYRWKEETKINNLAKKSSKSSNF